MGRFIKTAELDSFDALYRAALKAVAAGEQTLELSTVELCMLLSRVSKTTDTGLQRLMPRPTTQTDGRTRQADAGSRSRAPLSLSPAPRGDDWASLNDLLARG